MHSPPPQPALPIGGTVTVYVDRVRGYDLASVMRHELGHVLGLGHDANGRLMSSHYTASRQQCIDRAAAEAVAASSRISTRRRSIGAKRPTSPTHLTISVTQAANRATR